MPTNGWIAVFKDGPMPEQVRYRLAGVLDSIPGATPIASYNVA